MATTGQENLVTVCRRFPLADPMTIHGASDLVIGAGVGATGSWGTGAQIAMRGVLTGNGSLIRTDQVRSDYVGGGRGRD